MHASHAWCGVHFCRWTATCRRRCDPHSRALPCSSSCQHLRRLRPRLAPTSSWLPCRFKLYRCVYVRSLTYVLQVEAVVAGDHDKLAGCWVAERDMSFSKLNFLQHTAWLMESRHNRDGVQRRACWLNVCVDVRATGQSSQGSNVCVYVQVLQDEHLKREKIKKLTDEVRLCGWVLSFYRRSAAASSAAAAAASPAATATACCRSRRMLLLQLTSLIDTCMHTLRAHTHSYT